MAEYNNPVFRILRSIHKRIPAKYYRFYYGYLWSKINFYNVYVKTFFKMRLPLTLFEGQDVSGQAPLTFAYFGEKAQDIEYWAGLLLAPGFKKDVLGKDWLWQVRNTIKESHPSCSMLIVETTPFSLRILSGHKGLQSTQWMRMAIDIPESAETVWGRRRAKSSDIIRRIRKNNLSYITSTAPEAFDEFYHKMYVPFITAKHKKEALTADYFTIKNLFLKGLLLFIKQGEDIVAGQIIVLEKEKAVLKVLGIKDGKCEYLRWGVVGAMYYFSLLEMQKRGYEVLDIGRTRSVFTNGVTKYKINMCARLHSDRSLLKDRMVIEFLKDTPGLRNFLIHNPFLYYKERVGACRALFVENNQFENKEDFGKYFTAYNCDGLGGTSIFVFGDLDKIQDWVRALRYKDVSVEPAERLLF
jgi:hypothetical protein